MVDGGGRWRSIIQPHRGGPHAPHAITRPVWLGLLRLCGRVTPPCGVDILCRSNQRARAPRKPSRSIPCTCLLYQINYSFPRPGGASTQTSQRDDSITSECSSKHRGLPEWPHVYSNHICYGEPWAEHLLGTVIMEYHSSSYPPSAFSAA